MSLAVLTMTQCERCGAEMAPWQAAGANPRICASCADWCSPRVPVSESLPNRPVRAAPPRETPVEPELPESTDAWERIRQGNVPYPQRR